MRPAIHMRLHDGDPIQAGEVSLTPRAWVLSVRVANAALVWTRPTSVRIERRGRTNRQAIVDVTGIALCAIAAVTLAASALAMLWRADRKPA